MDSQSMSSSFPYSKCSSQEQELMIFPILSSMASTQKLPSRDDDDNKSIISMATTTANEGSPSNSIVSAHRQYHYHRTDITSLPAARFKGVVMQHNGHWGAQIYANHNRIWLGTFKSERAAATAYDSAAIKLHGGSSPHRNFPWTDINVHEPAFQNQFTTEVVLDMIKDGSYEARFAEFLRINQSSCKPLSASAGPNDHAVTIGRDGMMEMFQKELTPSDVGKLNRLVIPKKHATRHLPQVPSDAMEELLLQFRDRENRVWVFRYCYWKSSQSFVFTKGWNKFVKEKGLKANDVVVFYYCEDRIGSRRNYFMIDTVRNTNNNNNHDNNKVDIGDHEGGTEELDIGLEREEKIGGEEKKQEGEGEGQEEQSRKWVKLFGSWIG